MVRSVRDVRTSYSLERVRDGSQLRLGEASGKVLSNTTKVGLRCAPDSFPPSRSERSGHYAGVSRITLPTDQTLLFQTVHHPREPTGRDHYSFGELAHCELPAFSASKAQQNVVLREAQLVGATQLGVQRPGDLMVSVEKGLPCIHLHIAEFFAHIAGR